MKNLILISTLIFSTMAQGGPPVSQNPPITIPLPSTEKKVKPKKVKQRKPTAVILDARPFFEYSLNHGETAQPIRWEDYMLEPDLTVMAHKLRALGIAPDSEVLVMGDGVSGHGEEGRIAWMLKYLGVHKIKLTTFAEYKGRKNSYERRDNWAPPVWVPKADEAMRIKLSEIEKNTDITLIDTRSPEEFSKGHIDGAISIFWKDFVNGDIKKLLTDKKVDLKKEIVFYDEGGIGAAYAAYVTADNGFPSRFYDGGYNEWKNGKTK